MSKGKKRMAVELDELLPNAEEVEIFRERMLVFLSERSQRPPLPDDVLRKTIERGPCGVLLKGLIPSLLDHGYPAGLDTLSDASHAVEFYEHDRIYNPLGIALADAVFCAMNLVGPALDMNEAEAYLWRLCYRLSCRAALERDSRKATVERTISKANKARVEPRWDTQAAIAYVPRNARTVDGRLKSKAALSRELYQHLWHESRQGDGRVFTLACEGINSDGSGKPTDRALKTIQGWIAAVYAAQK
jgi:hypothetical protein